MKLALVLVISFILSIFPGISQVLDDYRSNVATGTWSAPGSWQRFDGTSWIAATAAPAAGTAQTITIQNGHTIQINSAVTMDQVIISFGGTLNWTASTCTIANGSAVDLQIDGMFWDNRGANTPSVVFSGGSTWQMGANGTLRRSAGNSSNNWQGAYEGGIGNIPATSNWVLQKNTGQNPSISSTGAVYGNLTIENNFGGTWVTAGGSTFTGGGTPTIKGNLDIGGSGTSTVNFTNGTTNIFPTIVNGNVLVRTGNTLQNTGSGLEVQGNLTNNGTISYTGATSTLIFSGSSAQTLTNTGTLGICNFTINKIPTNTLTLNNQVTIDKTATFTSGIINNSISSLFILNTAATVTGANNASFVNGPVRYLGGSAFTFPVGKGTSYRFIGLGSGTSPGGTFWTETFDNGCTNACTANGVNTGNGAWTIDNSNNPPLDNCGAVPRSNVWYVSCKENGNASGACGSTCGSNATLHIGSTTAGDQGGSFDAGSYCDSFGGGPFWGSGTNTNTMVVSPTISTIGQTNITLSFNYLHYGQLGVDFGWVDYSTDNGTSWNTLANPLPQTVCCSGPCDNFHQGQWATYSTLLPASAENIAGFKIRFGWINNDDGLGNDPSIAINNITLSVPLGPASSFTAEYFPSNPQTLYGNILAPTLTNLSDCEYWILTRDVGTDNRTVTLSWNAATCYNTAYNSFEVARHDGLSTWQDHDGTLSGGASATGGNVTTPVPVTSFSPFAIAYIPLPLPIELLKFDAECNDGKVKLSWQTSSEINNDYFTIEKSIDMIEWKEVKRMDGAGNSNSTLSYETIDPDPFTENYYRLKQTDYNGNSEIFNPIFVKCTNTNNEIKVYPNPTTGIVYVDIPNGSVMQAADVINSIGQPVIKITTGDVKGGVIHSFDLSQLSAGTYYLRILMDGEWVTKPLNIIR